MEGRLLRNPDYIQARVHPLAFLMAESVLENLKNLKNGMPDLQKINPTNIFEAAVDYENWLAQAPSSLQKYLNFDIIKMWIMQNGGENASVFEQDFPMAIRTFGAIEGRKYAVRQTAKSLQLGYGWSATNVLVALTGEENSLSASVPQEIRKADPPVFWREGATEKQKDDLKSLISAAARTMVDLDNQTCVEVTQGSMTGVNKVRKASLREVLALLGEWNPEWLAYIRNKEGIQYARFDEPQGLKTIQSALEKGARGLTKNIKTVAGYASRVATDFTEDYAGRDPRINKKSLARCTDTLMSLWPALFLLYWKRYYNDPTIEALKKTGFSPKTNLTLAKL